MWNHPDIQDAINAYRRGLAAYRRWRGKGNEGACNRFSILGQGQWVEDYRRSRSRNFVGTAGITCLRLCVNAHVYTEQFRDVTHKIPMHQHASLLPSAALTEEAAPVQQRHCAGPKLS